MIRSILSLLFLTFFICLTSCLSDKTAEKTAVAENTVTPQKASQNIKTRENTLVGFKENKAVMGNGQMVEVPGLVDEKQSVFILVRHAEKELTGDDPGLTAEGQQRASRLDDILKNITVHQVMSTDYERTKSTVASLAKAKRTAVQIYDPSMQNDLFIDLAVFNKHNIVVAGHSNTIPGLANFLIGKPVFEDFSEDEYDHIIIISAEQPGKATYLSLNY